MFVGQFLDLYAPEQDSPVRPWVQQCLSKFNFLIYDENDNNNNYDDDGSRETIDDHKQLIFPFFFTFISFFFLSFTDGGTDRQTRRIIEMLWRN